MYTGLMGKVIIGDDSEVKALAYISNWSVESTTDMIEITSLGKSTKDKRPGLRSWTAGADGAVEFGTLVSSTEMGHKALFDAKNKGDVVNCKFYLDVTTGKEVYLSGTGYIESLSVDLSAEDKGNISISINGIGDLELTTAPAQS